MTEQQHYRALPSGQCVDHGVHQILRTFEEIMQQQAPSFSRRSTIMIA